MKMRGCSVLFVSALCVFVLCGAAAAVAVAEDVAHEKEAEEVKAARDAKAMADVAKEKGDEVVSIHEMFVGNVSGVMSSLSSAIDKITALKAPASKINQENEHVKEEALQGTNRLKAQMEAAKTAVEALRDAEAVVFNNRQTKAILTDIMNEVENKMNVVMGQAAAFVTGNLSAIVAAIGKVGELETAAGNAKDLWGVALIKLTTQLSKVMAAVNAINTTKSEMERVVNKFGSSKDSEAQKVKELSPVLKELEPLLKKLMILRNVALNATDPVRVASKRYNSLVARAKRLAHAAGHRKRLLNKNSTSMVKRDTNEMLKAANTTANLAKQTGSKALCVRREFFIKNVNEVVIDLGEAMKKVNTCEEIVGRIGQGLPNSTVATRLIEELEEKAKSARSAVTALQGAVTATFQKEQKKTALSKIMEEVKNNMTEVAEKAAAIVTDDVSIIGAAIEKAGELERAADEAKNLWDVAMGDLTQQLGKAREAVSAVQTTKGGIENAVGKFESSKDLQAKTVKKELSSTLEDLEPSLEKLTFVQSASLNAIEAARVASAQYDALAAKARTFKQAAEGRRQRVKNKNVGPTLPLSEFQLSELETDDYSAGPLCSLLTLPVFFFCWCALFGM